MKQIIALQEYTDKFISLYEGEIRNIEDNLADKLIEEGIVAEHSDSSGDSGENNNIVKVNFTYVRAEDKMISDKTFDELLDALDDGKILLGVLSEKMTTGSTAVCDVSWVSFYTGTFRLTFSGSTYLLRQSDVNEWTKTGQNK